MYFLQCGGIYIHFSDLQWRWKIQSLQQEVATHASPPQGEKWYSNTITFTDFPNPNPWLGETLFLGNMQMKRKEKKNCPADSSLKKIINGLVSCKKRMKEESSNHIHESISFFFLIYEPAWGHSSTLLPPRLPPHGALSSCNLGFTISISDNNGCNTTPPPCQGIKSVSPQRLATN